MHLENDQNQANERVLPVQLRMTGSTDRDPSSGNVSGTTSKLRWLGPRNEADFRSFD